MIGPHPDIDPDLAREVLGKVPPSTFSLAGMIALSRDAPAPPSEEDRAEAATEEMGAEETLGDVADRDEGTPRCGHAGLGDRRR